MILVRELPQDLDLDVHFIQGNSSVGGEAEGCGQSLASRAPGLGGIVIQDMAELGCEIETNKVIQGVARDYSSRGKRQCMW